jgi:hypothetical protein
MRRPEPPSGYSIALPLVAAKLPSKYKYVFEEDLDRT